MDLASPAVSGTSVYANGLNGFKFDATRFCRLYRQSTTLTTARGLCASSVPARSIPVPLFSVENLKLTVRSQEWESSNFVRSDLFRNFDNKKKFSEPDEPPWSVYHKRFTPNYLSSSKELSMHHSSGTKLQCLTNTPTGFGARRSHPQAVLS